MIKKIPCGGFSYDDTEITFEDGVIHPAGGGAMVVHFVVGEDAAVTADKTPSELKEMLNIGVVSGVVSFIDISDNIHGVFMTLFFNGSQTLALCTAEIMDGKAYANPIVVADGEQWISN